MLRRIVLAGDPDISHDGYTPGSAVPSQEKVFCNGKAVIVDGDKYTPHFRPKNSIHTGHVKASASKLFIGGKAVALEDDDLDCGGKVTGSGNVYTE